ncbi:wax ester/triacylglycerol synthase family O-acyltransferase [soil metagenome]
MKQLAGLDASFLFLETPEMPMHVGALHVLELPPGTKGRYVDALRAHIASRLPLTPALRRRLVAMPLNLSNPGWVDAAPDMEVHIVSVRLPKNSRMAELEAAVGELHPVLLDRELPLWKFHVFEDLAPTEDGHKRVALYTQLHHAAVDGQAAVALASVLLDVSPEPRELNLPHAHASRAKRGQLGTAGMLRAALAQQWQQTLKLARALPGAATTLSQMAAQSAGVAAGGGLKSLLARLTGKTSEKSVSNLGLAPRTRLNVSLSATRSFATVSIPLAELNKARRKHGASLNDAVLFIVGSALRRLFTKHGPCPKKPLIAAVPVSMRAAGDTTSNTQATMSVVSLGTHIANPDKRLAHVLAAAAAMKASLGSVKSLMPTDFPALGVPWLMQAGALLYGRAQIAEKLPAFANLVISNVPGPLMPLYMAGAKMITNYPASIVVHGMALNITVQTYDQHLDLGLMACGVALPETAELAAYVEAAFLEFQALEPAVAPAAEAAAAPSAKKKTVTKATGKPRASARKKAAAAG